ncbi:hypothetical protein [Christiangramia echinicola]|uniref:hypothetical protein n=1 Tax=Christiangramia echinicola TaxID=279359 RepID=UPI0003F8B857|nr:hypothetical protein [Christiangramia echinicola]
MKRNKIIQKIQNLDFSTVRILLFLGVIAILASCEMEDDIPPPSAYVAPEPVEGCVQLEGVPELSEGIDFECLYPEFGTFGGTDAGTITVEPSDNPFIEGINTSDKVIMVTQTAGVEGWAGIFFDVANKIDFSEEQTIKVKVNSPAAGQTILLKLEDSADSSLNKEVSTTTTVAEGWEELSFTFAAGDSDKFDRMVLFFNFNGDKDATTVHYFDDINLGEAGPAEDPMKLPVTFDDPLVNYDVVPFGAEGTAFEIVTNPNLSGTNDIDSQVGAITKTGAAYEGATFNLSEALDLSGDNKTLSVKVYSEVAYTVLLKLETGVNDERSNEVSADHGGTGWETLNFDFATDATTSYQSDSDPGGEAIVPDGQYDQISLFLDLAGSASGTFYVDDLIYVEGDGGSATAPSEAAPTPTADAANVQSIFSDSYTDPAGINYYPDWGQSTTFEVLDFDGNEVIKYGNANYEGIDFGEALDLTSYSTLRIDVWSGDYTSILIFLISAGSGENSVNMNVTPNQWNTIEISLADFTSQGLDISDIIQIKFDVQPEVGGAFYLDNLYFTSEAAAVTEPQSAAPTPTADAGNVQSIFSDSYTDPAGINYYPDWGQSTTFEVLDFSGNEVIKYGNANYEGIDFGEALDLTSFSSLKIDVWSGDYTSIPIFLISSGSGEKSISMNVTPNQWNTIEIPLVDFTDQGLDISDIIQIKFDVQPDNGGSFYIDNLYFSKGTETSAPAEPTTAAPAPTAGSGDVISIFSDEYTDPTDINYYPDWGQSTTFEMITLEGSETIKYGNVNYQGIQFGEAFDLTAYNSVKIDVWSGDYTSISFFLISQGSGEKSVSLSVTPNTWTTIEIPLSDFTDQGLSVNDIHQIKFDVQPDNSGAFYIDNLYFQK